MEAESNDNPLVENALESAKYRVHPETPLCEVVDLMVRRDLRAVPVVGERCEVLGIITTGDALGDVLRDLPTDEAEGGSMGGIRTARDVMTRAVLCVSESQPLLDAARMMATRRVGQLPVVRDAELIGLITRDGTLRALHGKSLTTIDEAKEDT